MKSNPKKLLALSTICLLLVAGIITFKTNQKSEREKYEAFLREHPYMNRNFEEVSSLPKQDRPDLAFEHEYLITMDPKTKRPERDRLMKTFKDLKTQNLRLSDAPWVERGPSNVGGRTRALAWDPSTTNKVWAGGVTGGLWYNEDITISTSEWQGIDDFWDNLSITSIVFDPNNSDIMYVGTGEGWGVAAIRGEGVWKSSDGGATWSQLANSTGLNFVNDMVMRDESGTSVLYVASTRNYYQGNNHGSNGVYRSDDGGSTFTQVSTIGATDLSLAADDRIWVGTSSGDVFYSDGGTSFTESINTTNGRVALAAAPSNANYVYALVENSSVVEMIMYTDDQGATWNTTNEPADVDNGIPDTDFTRGQAWYDLIIKVDPLDENTVIVGGIDLFRTTDAGTNWDQISKWSNNNNLAALGVSLVHADQHAIVFKPGSSTEAIFGTDGGVYYSSEVQNSGSSAVINSRNTGYNVTQFYTCAIHPDAGEDQFLAGTQDNGTQRFTTAGINETNDVFGGDGAYCAIDQTEPSIQIVSYIRNYYGVSTNEGQSFSVVTSDVNSGLFINPADYDDNLNILYSSYDENNIQRITDIGGSESVGTISVSMGSTSSHLRVSPYTTSSTTLFAGTLSGRVYKITGADTGSPSVTEITGSSFPNATVSCIEIGADEDELLVTFSNYGVTSIWYSNDGGSSWESKEGDFPDMPLRWALFNPQNRSEVILATDLGVWSTTDISTSSPQWSASNVGLANVRVDMLQYRTSDNEVIAATHGRGLYSSNRFGAGAPRVDFSADQRVSCAGDLTVNFTNLTSSNPAATSFAWSFPGGSPSSSTEENPPSVTYSTPGIYDVSLVVTNDLGETTETKSEYISVASALTLPISEGFEGSTFPPDCWIAVRGDNGLGTGFDWSQSTTTNSGSGAAFVRYENVTGGLAEDWLITPEVNLSGGFNSTMTFFMKDTYPNDFGSTYQIRYSTTTQSDLSSFTVLEEWGETDISTDWTQRTVDLSSLDGSEVYLAFVLIQDDGDDWALDDVVISSTGTVEISISGSMEFCESDPSTLSVTENAEYTYQWQLDGADISGATSSEYTPTESGSYSVNVTFNSNTITSESIDVVVDAVPEITNQTGDVFGCTGETTSFEVEVEGSGLTYQWYYEGAVLEDSDVISGATTSTLSISSLELSMEGTYSCVVTNGNCESASPDMELTIVTALTISTQPEDVETCQSETVQFSVFASGSNLSYQWLLDGQAIQDDSQYSGATTDELTITGVTTDISGLYSCMVSSDCEPLESDEATLTVNVCTSTPGSLSNVIDVFPNPTNGEFQIDFGQIQFDGPISIQVIGLDGKTKLSKEIIQNNKTQHAFDLTDFAKGMYVIRISTERQTFTKSIIVD